MSKVPTAGEVAQDYILLGGEHLERGRRLFVTGIVGLVALLCYLTYTANVGNPLHLLQGLLIVVLSLLPSLLWARTGGSRFPVFEAMLLLCTNAYAIPLLNAREQLEGYHNDVITRSGWVVILYLVTANLVYRTTTGIPGRSRFWRESLISNRVERLIVYGLIASTIYITVNTFTRWIPRELESIFRAVFFGISTLCTFISSQRLGRGQMLPDERYVYFITLTIQLMLMTTGLLLVVPMSQIGIAILGYLSGGQRIPWLAIVATFGIFGLLHSGKMPMREKYWDQGHPPPTVTQLPAFFSEWITHGLQRADEKKASSRKLLERTSLMHILCLVCTYTPERQDYLYGATYAHVLPQLIPRFFWPDKPRSHVATYQLGMYYGLQDEESTQKTTIAFGLVTEAYANFGLFGAVLLGAFWGFILKKLQIWTTFSPMFSFAGLLMVLLTAWTFSSELTMAAWVSSFEQAVIVVLGAPLLLRSLFGF